MGICAAGIRGPHRHAIFVVVFFLTPLGISDPSRARPFDEPLPPVHDIHFPNIFGTAEAGMVLYGNEKAWLKGITFDQAHFTLRSPRKEVAKLAGGNFDFRWPPGTLARAVFEHDIPALYLRFVKGVPIDGLRLDWGEDLPDYFSDGIEHEDFRDLSIDRFESRAARGDANLAAVSLLRAQGISIVNKRALPGTGGFLKSANVTGKGLFVLNDLREAKREFSKNPGGFTLTGNLMPSKPSLVFCCKGETNGTACVG
jgi:hypothetical protein